MPRDGSTFRGDQMGLLARLTHEMAIDPKIGECLAIVEGSPLVKNADAPEAINVREIRRAYDRAVKLPKELVEEIARVTTRAQQVWQEARASNDFAAFQPWLEKVVALKRREADAVGYKEHPYDALLDEYEPGATASQVRQVFAALFGGVGAVDRSHRAVEAKAASRPIGTGISGRCSGGLRSFRRRGDRL